MRVLEVVFGRRAAAIRAAAQYVLLQLDSEEDIEDTHVNPTPPPEFEDPALTRAAVPGTRRRRRAPSRQELEAMLTVCRGSVAEVARRLNRQYAVVWRNIQRYGIDASEYRDSSG